MDYDEYMRATTPHLLVGRTQLWVFGRRFPIPVWVVLLREVGTSCVVFARTEGRARYRGQRWHLRTTGRWQNL